MEKKLYRQPKTISTLMEPQSVLCASPGGGTYIKTTDVVVNGESGF